MREIVTSSASTARARSVLSMHSATFANPIGFLSVVPWKITSSIFSPRRVFAPCSPITQRRASLMLLLPLPLLPTTAVVWASKFSTVLSAKDLNPCISSDLKNIHKPQCLSQLDVRPFQRFHIDVIPQLPQSRDIAAFLSDCPADVPAVGV